MASCPAQSTTLLSSQDQVPATAAKQPSRLQHKARGPCHLQQRQHRHHNSNPNRSQLLQHSNSHQHQPSHHRHQHPLQLQLRLLQLIHQRRLNSSSQQQQCQPQVPQTAGQMWSLHPLRASLLLQLAKIRSTCRGKMETLASAR
jgi:hypothetical protein